MLHCLCWIIRRVFQKVIRKYYSGPNLLLAFENYFSTNKTWKKNWNMKKNMKFFTWYTWYKHNTIKEIGEEINMCYLNKLTVGFKNLHDIYHE